MPRIALLPEASQSLSFEAGEKSVELEITYVARFGYFRVNAYDISDTKEVITLGRSANPGVNMFSGVRGFGRLVMTGEQATVENLGITAVLTWEAD